VHWRVGTITARIRSWDDAVEYAVALPPASGLPDSVRAVGYRSIVGDLLAGDRVLLNASALLRALGTGGYAFIVAAPDRLPPDPPSGPGHIVKARYTPLQQMLLAVDEQESAHHTAMTTGPAASGDLAGMPVIVADLHSALAPIVCGVRSLRSDLRVVYVMTDGGALPIAFSRAVSALRAAGWIAATVTAGQAFGGDHEAVTLHSGLLAARWVLDADLCVVIQGPGNVGTGTAYGFSGVAVGEALNAVDVLGGRGVGALRISAADPRPRHQGISHHSRTAYGRILLGGATLVVPALDGPFGDLVRDQAHALASTARGRLDLAAEPVEGLDDALAASPTPLSSMGRGLSEDREYFLAQAAAGRYAARLPAATVRVT
jgi:hypothetical protein